MRGTRRVLVTRPQPDADRTAAMLADAGLTPVTAPLMTIVPRTEAAAGMPPHDVVAFTSANGVRSMAALTLERRPCFAIGEASAAEAEALGFEVAGVGSSDVASLAEVIAAKAPGRVLHAAGAERAGDLVASLTARNIHCDRAVLYDAVVAATLPGAAEAALRDGLFALLLMSPRSARLLASLIAEAGLGERLHGTILAALSPAVADAFPLRTAEIFVPPAPRLAALVDFLSGGGT